MNKSDLLIRICIWLALVGYALGAAYALARGGRRWERTAKLIWTTSGLLLFLHVGFALHFVHHWNQASVYVETARQTVEVFSVNWGGGMYVNYALLSLWLLDILWWWIAPDAYRRRPRWLTLVWQGFLLFIFFNATVVFVSGFLRWLGLFGTVALLGLWWHTPRNKPLTA